MSHINNAASSSPIPGTVVLNYTPVVFAQSPYTVLPTDDFIGADPVGGPITILLPDTPETGRTYIVKDVSANAFINNITVTTVSGIDFIDDATTYVINTDLQSAQFLFNGTHYLIY